MSKLLTFMLIGLFLFSLTSVSAFWKDTTFEVDNSKIAERSLELGKETTTLYGKYIVTSHKWYDPLKIWTEEVTQEITLKENSDSCGNDCFAIKEIQNFKEGSLIDDVRFYRIEDGKQTLENIRSWQIEIWDNPLESTEEYVENVCSGGYEDEEGYIDEVCIPVVKTRSYYYKLVDDYKYVCEKTGELSKNGTAIEECRNEVIGQKEYRYSGWVNYNLKDKLPEGTYTIKLSGSKRFDRTYDWQIKLGETSEWSLNWAIWGVSDMTEGLVAQYRANTQNFTLNNQTQVLDFTGSNNGTLSGRTFNNGNVSGGVTIEDGAMKFNGVDGVVTGASIPNLGITSNSSFSIWINTASSTGARQIILQNSYSANERVGLNLGTTGTSLSFGFYNGSSWTSKSGTTGFGSWTHIVGTINNGVVNLYINGISQTGSTSPNVGGGTNLFIGSREGASEWFNGSIDDTLIFNRALSSTEITQLYNQGRGSYSSVTNGLVAQYSGRDYAGTEATPTTIYDTNHLGDGKVLESLSFDGVNDYVNLGSMNFTNATSFSAWVKPLTNTSDHAIIGDVGGDDFVWWLDTQGTSLRQAYTIGTAYYSTSSSIPINTYTHVLININSTHVSFYKNGVLDVIRAGTVDPSVIANYNLHIGDDSENGKRFNGSLDDVRIYNRSLSADEIAYLYNSGMGREDSSDAWVVLNSPANNSIQYTNLVTVNATAYVESGAYLVNASLNLSVNGGAWEIRNTTSNILTVPSTNSHNITFASDTSTIKYGIQFTMKQNAFLNNVTSEAFDTSTKAYLYWGNNTLITTKDVTSHVANFENYLLLEGQSYQIVMDNNGGSRTVRRGTTASFPLESDALTFTNYPNSSITAADNWVGSVESINVFKAGTSSTQTFTNTFNAGDVVDFNYLFGDSDGDIGQSETRRFTIDDLAPTINASLNETILYAEGDVVQLNTTITDVNIDKVWYSYNGTNTTIDDVVSGEVNLSNIVTTFTALEIIVYANDTAGNTATPVILNLTLDSTAPTINLSYPTALIDYGKLNGTLELNFTATDSNLDKVWYIYGQLGHDTFESSNDGWTGGERSEVWSSQGNWSYKIIGGTFDSPIKYYSKSVNFDDIQGLYYDIKTTDTTSTYWTRISIGGDLIKEYNSSDTFLNEYINTSNITGTKEITFSSRGSSFGQSISYIDNIIYLGEGERVDIAGAVSGVYNISNITLSTKKNVTIYANDTAGNLYSEVFGWDYKVFENSRSFTTPIVETSIDTFRINVTADVSLTSVYLNYNGTEYSTSLSGGVYTKQLTIPAVSEESVMQVYWRFIYDGTNITSDITNQTISKLTFNICNATINNTLINFTTRSATNPFPIVNSTFKSSWMLSASIGATPTNFTYEDIAGNKSSYAFCTNTNTTTIYTDAEIEYDGSEYALNFYYLDDVNLTALSPQNISLYLLNDSLSTVTILKIVSASQQPQADHQINIQSYDVGTGTFYLVGMAKTNFNGEDVVYLNWYDTLYKFIVLDSSGEVVKTTGTTKISSTPTTIELENEITFPYDKFKDFVYSLYYENTTSNFVLTYTKPSGEVDEACLRVYKHGDGNDTLVCDTCETSASATLFCNVASYGNGTYVGIFYATGSFSLVDWIYEYVGGTFQTTIYNLLGNEDASFYAFMFAGLITVALFINAVFGIIALMIGLIGASVLGFTALQWGQMTGVIIIGGFIIWILKR